MADPTLDEIAVALYAGAPEEFVTARDTRAKEVADPTLAAAVRAFRKPSVAAWVVNVFAQERAAQLGEALQLAAELREAQDDLDGPALAKLGRERRALTRRLAEAAAELARSRGERITTATVEAVEQSISAAFFDQDAAAAVASGRLLRALDPSTSADDVRDAVAGELSSVEPVDPRPPDELQARRVRREAERRLAAAEKEQASAERELAKHDAVLEKLQARADELAEKAKALETELTRLREEAARVGRDLPGVSDTRARAAAQADAATDAVDQARRELDAL